MKQLFNDLKHYFLNKFRVFAIGAVVALTALNQFMLLDINTELGGPKFSLRLAGVLGGLSQENGGSDSAFDLPKEGDPVSRAMTVLIKQGVPEIYGASLGVSYDQPATDINKLAALDTNIDTNSLTPEEKERYIDIAGRISCEFCCGAKSVIFGDGRAACGCAHSAAFRGLAKYLLKNYPDLSNDRILKELTIWKSLFYPKNMVEKATALINNNMPLTVNALNDIDLLKKIQTGDTGSVGTEQLPEMIGGC